MIVDVIDWHAVSDEFRAVIEKNYVVIRKSLKGPE